MGNSAGVPYSFQQEPLHGVVVASDANRNQNNTNVQNNDVNGNINNSANNVSSNNINNASNNANVINGDNNANGARPGNFIISLAPRRGLDGDNLFGAIRNDLASYFPFGRFAPPPPIHQATTIKSLVNLHKDSVVFTREGEGDMYKLHFKFDALEPCVIKVYLNATEILDEDKKPVMQGKVEIGPMCYPAGTGQLFAHPPDRLLDVDSISESLTTIKPESHHPLVIQIRCDPTFPASNNLHLHPIDTSRPDTTPSASASTTTSSTSTSTSTTTVITDSSKPDVAIIRSQTTYCTVLACGDGSYALKVAQQKIHHRDTTYVVHDIFGLDHTGERESEGSRECVVCMSEPRDTTVLPCRHLCVCAPCAELMRMQTNKCPICRAPVTSLLKITLSNNKEGGKEKAGGGVGVVPPLRASQGTDATTTTATTATTAATTTPTPPKAVDEEDEDEHLLTRREKDRKDLVV
jgi:E3 ubiquitin-protein ligase MGRN1